MIKLVSILNEIQIYTGVSTDKLMDKLWVDLPDGEPTEQWRELTNLIYDKYHYKGSSDFEEVTDWVDSLKPNIKNLLYKDILQIVD